MYFSLNSVIHEDRATTLTTTTISPAWITNRSQSEWTLLFLICIKAATRNARYLNGLKIIHTKLLCPGMLPVIAIIFILGFIFSMLGLGGALLYIPVFHGFGFEFKSVAIPTGLFLNGITALSASVYFFREKMVDVKGGMPMAITSLVAAPLGAWFTRFVATETLILLFSAGMAVAGVKMLLSSGQAEAKELMPVGRRAMITGTAGLFIGFLAGLLGIGGGFLFVPILIAIGYPTKQAAATSAFIVVFSSFSGFAGHVAQGHFNLPLLLYSSIAVVIASQIGARVMKEKMKSKWIKQIFGVLLVAVAVKLSWQHLL